MKKLVSILVVTLLIGTTLPVIGMTIKKTGNENFPPIQSGSIDQEQTTNCGTGVILSPPELTAQSFKPTKENLTAVQLWIFKYETPPDDVEITVSIRDDLYGADLTAKTINADDARIKGSGTWVFFNFDDITVIPEETYYIVCYASDGGPEGNCYCWLFDINDKYTRGEAWVYNNTAGEWITLWEAMGFDPEWPEPDLCFKTYFQKSRNKFINTPFLNWLRNHPILFSVFQTLLQRFGLQ